MVGVLGLALICAAVLLLFYVARRRNSPNPPRWSRLGVTEHTTLILFLVGAVFGGSLILLLFIRKSGPQFGLTELVLSLGVSVVAVVLWRLIDRIPKLGQPANTETPIPTAAGPGKKHAA
jgi:cytochrome b561